MNLKNQMYDVRLTKITRRGASLSLNNVQGKDRFTDRSEGRETNNFGKNKNYWKINVQQTNFIYFFFFSYFRPIARKKNHVYLLFHPTSLVYPSLKTSLALTDNRVDN